MNAIFQELFHVGIYKRSQGRITRQVTFAALAVIVALGLMRLSGVLMTSDGAAKAAAWFGSYRLLLPLYWVASLCAWISAGPYFYMWFPLVLLAVALWVFYRLVNVPAVADFLVAVEAEMNKVSWPTRPELFRSSMVVLVLIISLAVTLAFCDFGFRVLLSWLGIL